MFSCKPRLLHSGLEPAGSRRMRQSHIWLVDECDRKRAAAEQCFDQRSKQSLCRPARWVLLSGVKLIGKNEEKRVRDDSLQSQSTTMHALETIEESAMTACLAFIRSIDGLCRNSRHTRCTTSDKKYECVWMLYERRDKPQVHQFKQYLHQWRYGHRRY